MDKYLRADSLPHKTSYNKISQSLEGAVLGFNCFDIGLHKSISASADEAPTKFQDNWKILTIGLARSIKTLRNLKISLLCDAEWSPVSVVILPALG